MVHKSIADMRKVYMAEEKERLATAEVEEQPVLKINPNRGPRLQVHLPARAHASGYIFVDVDCMSRCRTCVSIRICKRVGASARVTWRPTSTGSASLRKRIRITRPCPPAAG